MQKLLTFRDLLAILQISEPTLRRWIAEARRGTGNFIKPVAGFKRKLLFRPEDFERWMKCHQQSTPVPNIESPTQRAKRHTAAMKSLANKGVVLPSQK